MAWLVANGNEKRQMENLICCDHDRNISQLARSTENVCPTSRARCSGLRLGLLEFDRLRSQRVEL